MHEAESLDVLRQSCLPWVRRAGELARERMTRARASRKADRSLVTDADQAVQDFLMEEISRRFPADAVISEETQKDPGRHAARGAARRCWIIDPIDGTRNYVRRVPFFAVSVGLLQDGVPLAGFVHVPMLDQVYSAAAGCGAWCDDERLDCRAEKDDGDLFVAVPSGREEPLPPPVHQWIDRMVQRATGSTALNMVLMAAGRFDAAFGKNCKLWDIAGAACIIAEAGGVLVDHQGRSHFPFDVVRYEGGPTPFIAARPGLVQRFLADLAS